MIIVINEKANGILTITHLEMIANNLVREQSSCISKMFLFSTAPKGAFSLLALFFSVPKGKSRVSIINRSELLVSLSHDV
jgi:hypothetical protein